MIKVSIIVPCYNVEKYVSSCLNSLLQQTYSNIEIIVVNDGSSDGTSVILQQYANIAKIKVINQENSGLSDARNTGIKNAQGEYICFVDSDDWVDHDMVEKVLSIALQDNQDVVLWGYLKEYNSKCIAQPLSQQIETYTSSNIHLLYQRIIGPVREQLQHPEYVDSYITAWGKLYKASIIKDNHIEFVSTKEIGTEDLLFNVYYFSYVKSAIILPDCFSHYRKNNESSLTSVYKPELFDRWTRLQYLIWDKIKGHSLLEEAYYNRIACTMIGLGLNEMYAESSYFQHKKNILCILNEKRYVKAFRNLKYSYLPLHWKVFFLSCRFRVFIVYWALTGIIKKIICK